MAEHGLKDTAVAVRVGPGPPAGPSIQCLPEFDSLQVIFKGEHCWQQATGFRDRVQQVLRMRRTSPRLELLPQSDPFAGENPHQPDRGCLVTKSLPADYSTQDVGELLTGNEVADEVNFLPRKASGCGSECAAPPDAVAYYYHHTAQLGPKYFGDWDFTEGLEDATAPLLLVYGEQDSLAISEQREWASSVPNGRLLLVPDAGKPAFSDNPDFVFPAIDTFFRGAWPVAARRIDR